MKWLHTIAIVVVVIIIITYWAIIGHLRWCGANSPSLLWATLEAKFNFSELSYLFSPEILRNNNNSEASGWSFVHCLFFEQCDLGGWREQANIANFASLIDDTRLFLPSLANRELPLMEAAAAAAAQFDLKPTILRLIGRTMVTQVWHLQTIRGSRRWIDRFELAIVSIYWILLNSREREREKSHTQLKCHWFALTLKLENVSTSFLWAIEAILVSEWAS